MEYRKPGEPLTLSYIPSSTVEPIISVKESDSLHRAITLMELNNFSQLPVVRGPGKHPKGVVTWESIGHALAMDPDAALKDCIDRNPPTFNLDDDLISAIGEINRAGYSLVVKCNKDLSGIVTSADLGTALTQIAQPFILLERLEEQLSSIIRELQTLGMVRQSDLHTRNPNSNGSTETTVDDLTLGEKIGLTTRPENWRQVTTIFERNAVVSSLEGAVRLRNRLMHFRPLEGDDPHVLASLPSLVATLTNISRSMPHK